MRSMGIGSGNDWKLAAIPDGFNAGGAWMLPRTAGAMTSRYAARVTVEGSGIGAKGSNVVGAGLLTIEGLGTGGLIAGAIGVADITITADGSIKAIISGVGAATITIDGVLTTGALGWLVGTGTLTVDATMNTYAIGWMIGTTDYTTELTTQAIAQEVWRSIATDFDDPGSMGEKLNDAGAAANPWTEDLPGSYIAGQAGHIIGTNLDAKVSEAGGGTPTEIADAVWDDLDAQFLLGCIKNKKYLSKENSTWYLIIKDHTETTDIIKKALKDKDGNNISDIAAGALAQELVSSV